ISIRPLRQGAQRPSAIQPRVGQLGASAGVINTALTAARLRRPVPCACVGTTAGHTAEGRTRNNVSMNEEQQLSELLAKTPESGTPGLSLPLHRITEQNYVPALTSAQRLIVRNGKVVQTARSDQARKRAQ